MLRAALQSNLDEEFVATPAFRTVELTESEPNASGQNFAISAVSSPEIGRASCRERV